MQALVPDPSLQKWRKAPSFFEGHAMREPGESSEPDSPATAEGSTENDSLATCPSPMAETDTRGKSSTCGGTPLVIRAAEPSTVVRKGSQRWEC